MTEKCATTDVVEESTAAGKVGMIYEILRKH